MIKRQNENGAESEDRQQREQVKMQMYSARQLWCFSSCLTTATCRSDT